MNSDTLRECPLLDAMAKKYCKDDSIDIRYYKVEVASPKENKNGKKELMDFIKSEYQIDVAPTVIWLQGGKELEHVSGPKIAKIIKVNRKYVSQIY